MACAGESSPFKMMFCYRFVFVFLALTLPSLVHSVNIEHISLSSEISRRLVRAIHHNTSCSFPGSPKHGRIIGKSTPKFLHGSTVRYECDKGYTLVGLEERVCREGQWSSQMPHCYREMARHKPALTNFNADADRIVDGNANSCAAWSTGSDRPMWAVDIIDSTPINYVKIIFGEHTTNLTLEIRVGKHHPRSAASFNKVYKRQTVDTVPGTPFYFSFPRETSHKKDAVQKPQGRFISIEVVNSKQKISVCEIEIFSNSSLASVDVCPDTEGRPRGLKQAFRNKCLEIMEKNVTPFKKAQTTCHAFGGRLIEHVDKTTRDFVNWQVGRQIGSETKFRLWLGAVRNKTSMKWHWLNGSKIEDAVITENTPDDAMGTSKQSHDCVTMEGSEWRSEDCARSNHVVCVYDTFSCGTPALPSKTENWNSVFGRRVEVNSTLDVRCENDFYLDDDIFRCLPDGSFPQNHPVCRASGCNTTLANGNISFVGATNLAKFSCDFGYILESSARDELRCTDGQWSSIKPVCLEDTKATRVLHEALDEVYQVKHAISKIPMFSSVSDQLLDWVILGAAVGGFISAFLLFLCCFCIRRKRSKSGTVKVTAFTAVEEPAAIRTEA